jgi:hypothetical protein
MSLFELALKDIREGLLSKRYAVILYDVACGNGGIPPLLSADGRSIVAVVSDGYMSYFGDFILNIGSRRNQYDKVIYIVTEERFRRFLKDSKLEEFYKLAVKYAEMVSPEDVEEVKKELGNLQGIYIASPKTVKEVFGIDAKSCRALPLTHEYIAKMIEGFIDTIEILVFK